MNLKVAPLAVASMLLLASCSTSQQSAAVASKSEHCSFCRQISAGQPMLFDVYFDKGSDVLIHDDYRRCCDVTFLKLNSDWLKQNPTRQIVITGYCDSVEGADQALAGLDFRRAKAMKEYLTKHGVKPERIRPVGGGALSGGRNEMAWAIQRRAEPTEVPLR